MAELPGNRFENVSSILKIFKLSVPSWSGEQWSGLNMRTPNFTVVIEQLTSNSYVMVVAADDKMSESPHIQSLIVV
jgi:Ras-related GTP-binding protein A/B